MKLLNLLATGLAVLTALLFTLVGLVLGLALLPRFSGLSLPPELVALTNLSSAQKAGLLASFFVYGGSLTALFWTLRCFAASHMGQIIPLRALEALFKRLALFSALMVMADASLKLLTAAPLVLMNLGPAVIFLALAYGLPRLSKYVQFN